MTNRQIMLKALNKKVIPSLLEQGFIGKYPNLKREKENCIEFIGFQANKWGGSFTVEVSAIFPNSKHNNCLGDLTAENVWGTSDRYRLDGMFDGWFYYSDVSMIDNNSYTNINEKEAETFIPPENYKLVQKFTPEVADLICDKVNNQFVKAFKWLDKFEKNNSKKSYHLMRHIKIELRGIYNEIWWKIKSLT